MTDTQIFHFAVKPGHDPVRLKSRSAHDTIKWIGKGFQCHTVCLELHKRFYIVNTPEAADLILSVRGKSNFNTLELVRWMNACVAKSVEKSGTSADDDATATI